MSKDPSSTKPIGVILAGGRGNRLGGTDKGLIQVNGRHLVELCIDNIGNQVSGIVISANRNLDIYRKFADIVIVDASPHYSGPLSGILSAMEYLKKKASILRGDLLTVPCDMPLLPTDLVARFYKTRSGCDMDRAVIAYDGHRIQPLCSLLPLSAQSSLDTFISAGNCRAMDWMHSIDALIADFSSDSGKFINVNTPDDTVALVNTLNNYG